MQVDDQDLPEKLPKNWTVAPLNLLGQWLGGSTPSKSNKSYWTDGEIPWVSPKDMKSDFIAGSIDRITNRALYETAINIVPPQSLLFVTRSGILRHSLPVASNTVPVTINQDIKALTVFDGVEPAFLRYQISAREAELRQAVVKTGVTVESVNFNALKASAILLTSPEGQRRIVDALDDWQLRIRGTKSHIDAAMALAQNLQDVTIEEAFSARGDVEWPEVELGEIVTKIVAGKNMRCRERPPRPHEKGVVKVSAVTWGKFDPLETKTLPDDFSPNPKTQIHPSDFLFSRANTRELVGACVIVAEVSDNIFLSDKILRLEMPEELKPWVMWYLRSPSGRNQLEARAHGSQQSMLNIPQKSLLSCRIPMPPLPVRERAISIIEKMLDLRAATEAACYAANARLADLEQAIMRLAFEGKLVPSSEGDTPVEKFLDELVDQQILASQRGKAPKETMQPMEQRPISDQIVEAVSRFPDSGIPFAELKLVISGQYEAIQQSIFHLLTTKNPPLIQVFDQKARRIVLKVNK